MARTNVVVTNVAKTNHVMKIVFGTNKVRKNVILAYIRRTNLRTNESETIMLKSVVTHDLKKYF